MVTNISYAGGWKWEFFRIFDDLTVPSCTNLKVFGNEKTNYDEAKRFCYFPKAKPIDGNQCIVYSIGSNNVWDFEVHMVKESDCKIETFDCSVANATMPDEIKSRTRFHKVCLGHATSEKKNSDNTFMPLAQLNTLVGRKEGPDYLKMDIEVRIFY
jgi:hypothetical protein